MLKANSNFAANYSVASHMLHFLEILLESFFKFTCNVAGRESEKRRLEL
jgi:hypothetical protein